jgi:Eukaryotic aspartyl protease
MATQSAAPPKTVRVPINNVYGGGDYTAQMSVGSQNAVVNLIMDTGSSTLAVKKGTYNPGSDKNLKPSAYAQDVTYGTGGWAGPVVTTNLTMGVPGNTITLQNSPMAIADEQQPHNFGAADGILGLAYNALNNAFNLTTYLQGRGINPPVTYPWPFPTRNSSAALAQLQQLLSQMPQDNIPPYFTEVESDGITANKFSFYTLRSVPNMSSANIAQDPLNNGFFILGGGEEQTDLYQGTFQNVDVEDDAWYNTNLQAVQVDGCVAVNALPLPTKYAQSMISNSIVDSGTNSLALSTDVLTAIMNSLKSLNPQFIQAINQATQSPSGIPASQLDLSKWPGISFILSGDSGHAIKLTCSPQTYWQVNAPKAGQAMFQINDMGSVQSILGLPLMNNYFTVFDRSLDSYGTIRFAPIKAS